MSRSGWSARSVLSAAVIAGCGSSGSEAAEPAAAAGAAMVAEEPTSPDPQALYEGFTRDHPWRAIVGTVGRWRLSRTEEWRQPAEGAEAWAPFDVLFAERAEGDVRVVAERDGMLTAAWIPLEDLAFVPVSRVALAAVPGGVADEGGPGVVLAPGAPVEVLERSAGWARVRASVPEVRAEGWVREGQLGRFYREGDHDVVEERPDLEPAPGAEVLDAPGGRVVAVLRPDAPADLRVRVKAVGDPREGWQEVVLPHARVLVRGWVRGESLAPASVERPTYWGHSVASFRLRGDIHWMQVPIGMRVWNGPDGDAFVVTTEGTKLVVVTERPPLGELVTIRTIWGDAPGWIPCMTPVEGMHWPLIDVCVPLFEEQWTAPDGLPACPAPAE